MPSIKKVVSQQINGIFVKRLMAEKGWTKKEAADFVVEYLFSGTKETYFDWMQAK